jgi:hypothetical protein
MTEQPQHMMALAKGNRTRFARAAMKAAVREGTPDLAEGARRLADFIASPPPELLTISLHVLLGDWPRRSGPTTVRRWLKDAGIVRHGKVRLDELTDREREALVARLRDGVTHKAVLPERPPPPKRRANLARVATSGRLLMTQRQLAILQQLRLAGERGVSSRGIAHSVGSNASGVTKTLQWMVRNGLAVGDPKCWKIKREGTG